MACVDYQVEREPLEAINNSNPHLICGLGVGGNNSEPNEKSMSPKRHTFRRVMSGYDITKKKWAIVPSTIGDQGDDGEYLSAHIHPKG